MQAKGIQAEKRERAGDAMSAHAKPRLRACKTPNKSGTSSRGQVQSGFRSAALDQDGTSYEGGRCSLRTKVRLLHSLFFDVEQLAVTPLDQLRLRLPPHELDLLMQAVKPVAEPDRDALLKDIAAELGQHEVVGPGLVHRIIREVQRRYDVADQRRSTG